MAGFVDPKVKRQKLCLKGRKTAGDHSNYDTDESTVSSEFSERTATSFFIDLTEDEDKPTDDNRTLDTSNNVEDEPKASKQLNQQLFSLRKTLVSLSRKLYNTVNGDNKWQDLKKFPDLLDEADSTETEITCNLPVETDTMTVAGHTFPWKPFPAPCVRCLCRKPSRLNDKVPIENINSSKDNSYDSIAPVSAVNSSSSRPKFTSSVDDNFVQKDIFRNGIKGRLGESAIFSNETSLGADRHQDQWSTDRENDHSQVRKRRLFKTTENNTASSLKQRTVNIGRGMKTKIGENRELEMVNDTDRYTSISAAESLMLTSTSDSRSHVTQPIELHPSSPLPVPDTLDKCPLCQTIFPKSMNPVDKDGHIAACYQASAEDFTW